MKIAPLFLSLGILLAGQAQAAGPVALKIVDLRQVPTMLADPHPSVLCSTKRYEAIDQDKRLRLQILAHTCTNFDPGARQRFSAGKNYYDIKLVAKSGLRISQDKVDGDKLLKNLGEARPGCALDLSVSGEGKLLDAGKFSCNKFSEGTSDAAEAVDAG